jgi:preprotein translocase subunit Sss1
MLTNFDSNNIPIGLAMVFGIIGYIGLIMNLKTEKKLKSECINFVFLLVGIIGFILFHSIKGGITAWKWIIFMEEPNEWIIFVGPMLMTIIITVMKGNLLLKGYKGNKSENTN